MSNDPAKIRSLHRKVKPTSPRKCLRCQKQFPSLGPNNRVCEICSILNSRESKQGSPIKSGGSIRGIHSGNMRGR
ncbi:hypothetical protein UFOVP991_9 [uncultured Caudovirales phage]|uniref:Uncharacterized protein n=1 Tax=uncultured Caudovirales phage TaxID=2100421 RepID=A0A6J5Q4A4_9CAUD|nr:hypothetical protein UFOVP991_9 [uncultured Caudovirales phage]CAB4182496.1 hypothetical protein UFOVP1076_9 [uncultured Caudovirales phage]CAB4198201.1 hypothetical protein UFOVP1314_52 [uncultured Caudovirales phage]CAB4211293.1 hypothetical protein UFOVP1427_18 [uncultured Caudovirales phage]CAB5237993.1 hypothetical protein UFOVP1523_22 [uncultured Caudovirales phage]